MLLAISKYTISVKKCEVLILKGDVLLSRKLEMRKLILTELYLFELLRTILKESKVPNISVFMH